MDTLFPFKIEKAIPFSENGFDMFYQLYTTLRPILESPPARAPRGEYEDCSLT
jgi:hypothetical protein